MLTYGDTWWLQGEATDKLKSLVALMHNDSRRECFDRYAKSSQKMILVYEALRYYYISP
jgi:hypothetical protein